MLDKLEYKIAKDLADHHLYPFAEHNYLSCFNAFSYFPVNFKDIGINEEGNTVTYLALVVHYCFKNRKSSFEETYQSILEKLKKEAQPFISQDIVVETFLGCILYFFHPSDLKSKISAINTAKLFNVEQQNEYELKKKTILIYSI